MSMSNKKPASGAGANPNGPPSGHPPSARPSVPRRRWPFSWLTTVGLAILGISFFGAVWVLWPLIYATWPPWSQTLEWKEEVGLEDGRTLLVSRRVVLVRGGNIGELPDVERERRLTFTHPTTGEVITWENGDTLGSRVHPKMLDFDGDRPVLVTVAQSGTDYAMLGCPTPPYIVFRYENRTWNRIPLAELPRRFVWLNLFPRVNKELLQSHRYFIRATATADVYRREPLNDHRALLATVDRRLRNPLGFGCESPYLDRIYGPGKYAEWRDTGNWLDKTEAEALRLLQGKREGGAKP